MSFPGLKDEGILVRKLSKGNLLAFNTLYREYSGRLLRFAAGYLKNDAEAEELVQEVFAIIWEKRADLKEEFSFRSFLFTIAFNLIRKHFRTRTYLNMYLKSDSGTGKDNSTSQKIIHDSLYQYITNLVERLPPRRREIFIKSRFEGKSIKQIADELQLSHKTIENQLTDALRFLRMNLNLEDPGQ